MAAEEYLETALGRLERRTSPKVSAVMLTNLLAQTRIERTALLEAAGAQTGLGGEAVRLAMGILYHRGVLLKVRDSGTFYVQLSTEGEEIASHFINLIKTPDEPLSQSLKTLTRTYSLELKVDKVVGKKSGVLNRSALVIMLSLASDGRTEKSAFLAAMTSELGNGAESLRKAIDFLNNQGLLLKVQNRGTHYAELSLEGLAKVDELLIDFDLD